MLYIFSPGFQLYFDFHVAFFKKGVAITNPFLNCLWIWNHTWKDCLSLWWKWSVLMFSSCTFIGSGRLVHLDPLIYLESVLKCVVKYRSIFFPVVLPPFVEMSFFTLFKKYWDYFWACFSISLVYLFIHIPIPLWFNYRRFLYVLSSVRALWVFF
jgi:hypothetical protein